MDLPGLEVILLIFPIASLVGVATCLVYHRLSRWLWTVALGFAVTAISSFVAVFPIAFFAGQPVSVDVGGLMFVGSVVSGFGFSAIPVGLALACTDIRAKFHQLRLSSAPNDQFRRACLPDAAELQPFRDDRENSHDIQP
jgi:hypothetical protein